MLPEADVFHSTGPFDGFTSSTLTLKHEDEYLPENAMNLVGRAAQEALGDGPHRESADVVVVLDDLELANRHQPDRVARVFRRAVEHHLKELQGARMRTENALRERVSFHLIVPMIEAWFFGDPQALRAAGVPAGVAPILSQEGLEDFRTLDLQYECASEADCPSWIAKGRKKADRPKWLGAQRERHPKGYLQWLCRDGAAKDCTSYDEVTEVQKHCGNWTGTLWPEAAARLPRRARRGSRRCTSRARPAEALCRRAVTVTSWHRRPRAHVLRNL